MSWNSIIASPNLALTLIPLQNDIETLGNEIKALMEENGSLKTKMKSLM